LPPPLGILRPKQVIFLEYVVREIIRYSSSAKDPKFALASGNPESFFDYIAGSERVAAVKRTDEMRRAIEVTAILRFRILSVPRPRRWPNYSACSGMSATDLKRCLSR
jgi:hypothetical protein